MRLSRTSCVISRTLDKFIIRWSCLQSSQIPLMNKLWLLSNSFWSTTDELVWLPKNSGMRIDSTSSSMMFPHDGLAKLIESNRYSGSCLMGFSKTFLTLTKSPGCSLNIMSRSTRSTDYQTSMNSADSALSLTSYSSEIEAVLFLSLLKYIDFSFLETYWDMQF